MRYLSLVVTIPVTVVIVVFAVNNRAPVALDPWPFDGGVSLPVFVVVLVPFIVGFVIGGLAHWISGVARRRQQRHQRQEQERRIRELEAEKLRSEHRAPTRAVIEPPPAVGASPRGI